MIELFSLRSKCHKVHSGELTDTGVERVHGQGKGKIGVPIEADFFKPLKNRKHSTATKKFCFGIIHDVFAHAGIFFHSAGKEFSEKGHLRDNIEHTESAEEWQHGIVQFGPDE